MLKFARWLAAPAWAVIIAACATAATTPPTPAAPEIDSVTPAYPSSYQPGQPPTFLVVGHGFTHGAKVQIWLLDYSTQPPTGEFTPMDPPDKATRWMNLIQYADNDGKLNAKVYWHYDLPPKGAVYFMATDFRKTPAGKHLYTNVCPGNEPNCGK